MLKVKKHASSKKKCTKYIKDIEYKKVDGFQWINTMFRRRKTCVILWLNFSLERAISILTVFITSWFSFNTLKDEFFIMKNNDV